MRKISTTELRLQEIQSKITKWSEFVRELPVPGDIAPAIVTGRLELIQLAQARPLTVEECSVLYKLIGGLLETNQALQEHTSLVANLAAEVRRGIGGIEGSASRLESYANYRLPHEDDDEALSA